MVEFIFLTAPIVAFIFIINCVSIARRVKQDQEAVIPTTICSFSLAYIIFSILFISSITY